MRGSEYRLVAALSSQNFICSVLDFREKTRTEQEDSLRAQVTDFSSRSKVEFRITTSEIQREGLLGAMTTSPAYVPDRILEFAIRRFEFTIPSNLVEVESGSSFVAEELYTFEEEVEERGGLEIDKGGVGNCYLLKKCRIVDFSASLEFSRNSPEIL